MAETPRLIRLISTTTVRAAASNLEVQSPPNRVELNPWDLQLFRLGPIQKGLLFLKPPTPSPEVQRFIVQHLKLSLSRTLDFFPILAGRLGVSDNANGTSSFFVDCNNAGADFVHAVADNVTVADILEPVFVPRIVHSFFPLNGLRNIDGVSNPLLAVQVTQLVDGFFVGCTVNHSIADGSSFWHFFNSWSEMSRGSFSMSRSPVFDRWFPGNVKPPISVLSRPDQIQDAFIVGPLEERVFHFPKEKITELKGKANAEMRMTTISSLQAVLAHVWRSVSRCNRVEGETMLLLGIGVRPRLQPPLPEGYFGNAVLYRGVSTTAEELIEKGLGWAAWQINEMISSHTSERVVELFESWVKDPNTWGPIEWKNETLATSSSPRFNVYGNDFGWGKPVAVRSGQGNKKSGKLTVFSGREEGSIDVEVCMSAEKLRALGADEEFMGAVTI